jgi:hypothetical protein
MTSNADASSLLPASQEEDPVTIVDVDEVIPTPVSLPDSAEIIESDEADVELLDAIRVIIYTADGVDIITISMLDRPSLDGQPKSMEDLVDEYLIYRDGASKSNISDETIDAGITQFKKQNNLSDAQLNEFFERGGYTLQEGRQEFKRLQMVSQMIDHNVSGKMRIIPESEIKRTYDADPVYREATYVLERAQVPEKVVRAALTKKTTVEWTELPEVKESELAAHLDFIKALKIGQISKPRRLENGEFELFRLKAKTERLLVSLEERRKEIVALLRRPRYEQALKEYKERLRSAAHVVYFNEETDTELAQAIKS